ncbi:MAG TPA: hypothetical protein PLD55_04195 [bacterium]|nr:hypothetical protein [bacterium]HOB72279.1 hypothetical protein [bacterium]HOG42929.1 hypothetical protein [bacterium]HPY13875.1 hypothetical protein [bacterium]HQB08289.1 hypothetical protein [bacterium]
MKRLLLLVILLSLINVGCKLAKFDREIFSDDQSSQDIDNAVADGESENETGTETETELYDKEIFNDDVSNIDFNEIDTVPDVEESGFCGDLIINNNEVCDGGTKECTEIDSFVFYAGNAPCKDDCSGWDVSFCRSRINGDICNGSFTVSNQENLDKIFLCREIGTLNVEDSDFSEIYFPFLETISGTFSISGNPALKNINFPVIKYIQYLDVDENTALELIDFPLLERIYQLYIINNNNLESFSLPSLTRVYKIYIKENLSLMSVTIPVLTGIFETLTIEGNPLLKTLELNQVDIIKADFLVNGNSSLVNFSMPHLLRIERDFELNMNSSLQGFDLLLLSYVGGDFTIKDNPVLPEIKVTDLFDQISDRDGIEGTVTIGDNGP